jgi:DNA-directed RNA polymerase specialized sigma24 family protein
MSLDELVRALNEGESRAEERLFRRLRLELLPFFRKRVGTCDAEDLTQATLLVIASELKTKPFEPAGPGSFRSFAFIVARYHFLTDLRTKRRRDRALPSLSGWWVVPESSVETSADEATMIRQQSALLDAAMAVIKTGFRRALESRLRDEDPRVFAEAEGIELGTVRWRICRALALVSAEIAARRRTPRVLTPNA